MNGLSVAETIGGVDWYRYIDAFNLFKVRFDADDEMDGFILFHSIPEHMRRETEDQAFVTAEGCVYLLPHSSYKSVQEYGNTLVPRSDETMSDRQWFSAIFGMLRSPSLSEPHSICERDVENVLCTSLENEGTPYRRQVKCASGRIDVLTERAIYEVKISVGRGEARGIEMQLKDYRASFPNRMLIAVAVNFTEGAIQYLSKKGIKTLTIEM